VLSVQHRSEPSVPRLVQEHRPAPAFHLVGLDGKAIDSSQVQNKTYVVNFFNSVVHPVPNRNEPALKAFYAEHQRDADFAMIGIVIDDDAATMRTYAAAQDITWPVGVDRRARRR